MSEKTKTDISKYTVSVQGKDFITFPGLLQEAHALGLSNISTTLINVEDTKSPIFKATVTLTSEGSDKSFTGYGDANENNVAKQVKGALIRMAETRAIARALRFACNISMAALEELDAEENVMSSNKPRKIMASAKSPPKPDKPDPKMSKSKTTESVKPSFSKMKANEAKAPYLKD